MRTIILLFSLIALPCFIAFMPMENEKAIETIAFGSCNRQSSPQPMWPFIVENNPQLWIWLGDNIYGDTEDMEVMKQKYDLQLSNEGYQKLTKNCPVIGIWDDHDYGVNDGGKEFVKKKETKALMLDFLGVAEDAEVRSREGAYQAYTYGPKGKQIKVILLDARYFRDNIQRDKSKKARYIPNEEGDILGEAQWAWLEAELDNSKAQVHLIASGIQFIPEEHRFEKWANFPKAQQRLMDLIGKTKPSKAILLSGDRHIAEVSKKEIKGLSYPLYEITSSGLTHSYEKAGKEKNKYRVSPLVGQKNYGILKFDWSGKVPKVRALVKGLENKVFIDLILD